MLELSLKKKKKVLKSCFFFPSFLQLLCPQLHSFFGFSTNYRLFEGTGSVREEVSSGGGGGGGGRRRIDRLNENYLETTTTTKKNPEKFTKKRKKKLTAVKDEKRCSKQYEIKFLIFV